MFEVFSRYQKLVVAFSQKEDGNLKLGNNPRQTAGKNRKKFFQKLGIDPKTVVTNGLVQEDTIQIVRKADRGNTLAETDGSITREKGVFLSVTAADCLPVFFFDPVKEVVGIAHAGWRGLAKGILPKVVIKIEKEFGSAPSHILVAVGPGIGVCHYEIGDDVIEHFRDFPSALVRREGKSFLDLKKIAAEQLQGVGIRRTHLEISPLCTYCEKDTYFSWRREKSHRDSVQAMLAVIGLRK